MRGEGECGAAGILWALGEDGVEERVTISTHGVEAEIDRFRLFMDSERGDMVALWVAVLLVMVILLVLPEPVWLLLVSAPVFLDTTWVAVWPFLVTVMISPTWLAVWPEMEMQDLVLLMVVIGVGLGMSGILPMACHNLRFVLP
jgi:hypothetical protein